MTRSEAWPHIQNLYLELNLHDVCLFTEHGEDARHLQQSCIVHLHESPDRSLQDHIQRGVECNPTCWVVKPELGLLASSNIGSVVKARGSELIRTC